MVEEREPGIGDILLHTKYGLVLYKVINKDKRHLHVNMIYNKNTKEIEDYNYLIGLGSTYQTDSYNLKLSDSREIVKAIFGSVPC